MKTFDEEEGLIFIENAQEGTYELKVNGKYPGGKYKVLIGQITANENKWFEAIGEINSIDPLSQTDEYEISFNPTNLSDFPIYQSNNDNLFNLLIQNLKIMYKDYANKHVLKAIDKIELAKKEFFKKNITAAKNHLAESEREIFKARDNSSTVLKNELYEILTQLENLFQKVSEEDNNKPNKKNLENKLKVMNMEYKKIENELLEKHNDGKNVYGKAIVLSQMLEKIKKAEENFEENDFALAEIVLYSANLLGKEIK